MINKLRHILTKAECGKLAVLSAGAFLLSLTETFSVGIILPIMGLFIDPGKIESSAPLRWLYLSLGSKSPADFLAALILIAIAAFIFKSLYSVYMLYAQQRAISAIYNRLTESVLSSYTHKPYSFHLANNSSVLFKNLSAAVGQFTSGFILPLVIIGSEFIVLAGLFIFLLCVYPLVTMMLIVIFSIVMAASHMFLRGRLRAYSVQREKSYEDMYKNALETLGAVKEIKAYDAQEFFVTRFARAIRDYSNSFVRFTVVSSLPRYALEMVLFSVILVSILVSVYIGKPSSEMVPMMTVMAVAALRLLPSISKISVNINLCHYSANSVDIVYDILKTQPVGKVEPSIPGTTSSRSGSKGALVFDNVSFRYDAAKEPIFDALSLDIPLRKMVAFVGATGAGKSTLIDIIMGLITPSAGAVIYDGKDITAGAISEYRKRIGYVPQNIFLTDDTIESNIAFGVNRPDIDKRRLLDAIRAAQLESFVGELPDGVHTMIGERGVRISGGQRQRIGIARALYRAPELLVFDEATSALDAHTEAGLYAALRGLGSDITLILVTHRISSLEKADIIYVIDSGRVIDKGTYTELEGRCKLFSQIARSYASATEETKEVS
jgi:ABC-type multidrug transport system fused ATPase/permease subunit